MTEFQKRKTRIAAAYRKLATDGYADSDDMEDCVKALETLSAAEVATEHKFFCTENY